MELLIALILLFTTVIECNTNEASVVADADSPSLSSPPEDSASVELLPSTNPGGDGHCPSLTSSHLFLFLLHLQCPATRDPLCVLGWPFDVKPPSNKFRCGRGPASDVGAAEWLPMVHLINASAFVSLAQRERPAQTGPAEQAEKENPWCMVANFYAPYCPFCARLAPYYNALPRVFPRLYVIAVDATDYSKLNSRYGITGTPTVILWHNGKAVARFDDSDYTLKGLTDFLQQWTDLEPARGVDVADEDLLGPLPSQPVVGRDYYLIISWLFILFCAGYYALRSAPATRLWEAIRTNFREANE